MTWPCPLSNNSDSHLLTSCSDMSMVNLWRLVVSIRYIMPVSGNNMDHDPSSHELPASLQLRPSKSYKTQTGVWCVSGIEEGAMFGPFVGEKLKKLRSTSDSAYVWEIVDERTSRYLYSIDATDPSKSNWMRHVKCAQYFEDQNLVSVQREGNIYYRAIREISVGEELLVWYELVKTRKKKKNDTPKKSLAQPKISPEKPQTGTKSTDNKVPKGSPTAVKGKKPSSSPAQGPPNKKSKIDTSSHKSENGDTVVKKTENSPPKSGELIKRPPDSPVRVTPKRKSKNIPSYNETMQIALLQIAGNNLRIKQYEAAAAKDNSLNEQTENGAELQVQSSSNEKRSVHSNSGEDRQVKSTKKREKKKNRNKNVIGRKKTKVKVGVSVDNVESTSKKVKRSRQSKSSPGPLKSENKPVEATNDKQETHRVPDMDDSAGKLFMKEYRNRNPLPKTAYVFKLEQHHTATGRMGRKIYKCDICSAVYRQAFSIKRHYIRNHVNYKYLSEIDLKNCNITPRMVMTQVSRMKKVSGEVDEGKTEKERWIGGNMSAGGKQERLIGGSSPVDAKEQTIKVGNNIAGDTKVDAIHSSCGKADDITDGKENCLGAGDRQKIVIGSTDCCDARDRILIGGKGNVSIEENVFGGTDTARDKEEILVGGKDDASSEVKLIGGTNFVDGKERILIGGKDNDNSEKIVTGGNDSDDGKAEILNDNCVALKDVLLICETGQATEKNVTSELGRDMVNDTHKSPSHGDSAGPDLSSDGGQSALVGNVSSGHIDAKNGGCTSRGGVGDMSAGEENVAGVSKQEQGEDCEKCVGDSFNSPTDTTVREFADLTQSQSLVPCDQVNNNDSGVKDSALIKDSCIVHDKQNSCGDGSVMSGTGTSHYEIGESSGDKEIGTKISKNSTELVNKDNSSKDIDSETTSKGDVSGVVINSSGKEEKLGKDHSEGLVQANNNVLQGLYYCNICGDLFDAPKELRSHAQSHSATEKEDVYEYSCSQCDMKFTQRQNLMRHSAVHTGARPYKCQYCGKTFPTSRNQKRHEKIHLGERVFTCVYCDHSFTKTGHLKKHVRYSHPLLFHECKLCKKYFPNLGLLQEHMKTHDSAAWEAYNKKNAKQEKESTENSQKSVVDGNGRRKREATKRLFMDDEYGSKNSDPTSFKFSCTVCKKKFGTYANMCRHRILQHERNGLVVGRRKPNQSDRKVASSSMKRRRGGVVPQPTPEEKATFYAQVAQEIASNLSYYIDGKKSSLDKCTAHIKSGDKLNSNQFSILSNIDWQRYNLPEGFGSSKPVTFINSSDEKETEPPVLTPVDQDDVTMETDSRSSSPPLLNAMSTDACIGNLPTNEALPTITETVPVGKKEDKESGAVSSMNDPVISEGSLSVTNGDESKVVSGVSRLFGPLGLRNVAHIDLMEELSVVTDLPYRPVTRYVCNVCQYEYFHYDDLVTHQNMDHPNVVCTYLELGHGENVPLLASPKPTGLLNRMASTCPMSVAPQPSNYVCTKCELGFTDISKLHGHIITCAGAEEDTPPLLSPADMNGEPKKRKHRISIKPLNAKKGRAPGKRKEDKSKVATPLKLNSKANGDVRSSTDAMSEEYKCTNCGRSCKSLAAVTTHQKYCVLRAQPNIFGKTKRIYIKKMKPALKKFVCKHCKRVFSYNGSFKKHVAESCPVLYGKGLSPKKKDGTLAKDGVDTPCKMQNKENVPGTSSPVKTYKTKPTIVLNPSTSDVIPILTVSNNAKQVKKRQRRKRRRTSTKDEDDLEMTSEELILLKIKGRKRTPVNNERNSLEVQVSDTVKKPTKVSPKTRKTPSPKTQKEESQISEISPNNGEKKVLKRKIVSPKMEKEESQTSEISLTNGEKKVLKRKKASPKMNKEEIQTSVISTINDEKKASPKDEDKKPSEIKRSKKKANAKVDDVVGSGDKDVSAGDCDVAELARRLSEQNGSLNGLDGTTAEDSQHVPGSPVVRKRKKESPKQLGLTTAKTNASSEKSSITKKVNETTPNKKSPKVRTTESDKKSEHKTKNTKSLLDTKTPEVKTKSPSLSSLNSKLESSRVSSNASKANANT